MAEPCALDLPNLEACVICLSRLSEKAIALPCAHSHFDFGCLCTWLHQQRVCPLCKTSVTGVKYDLTKSGGTTFTLPPPEPASPPKDRVGGHPRAHPYQPQYNSHGRLFGSSNVLSLPRSHVHRGFRLNMEAVLANEAIAFRRRVYRKQMYSLRVGSNRISQYQNITPDSFTCNELLVSRAKCWIRRELSAFDFVDPSSAKHGSSDRRASNAEFLLEYVVSILKSIDLRGSGGQAEELLKDFLGMENARLFLHEIEAFLRSPYEALETWDIHVQYAEMQGSRGRRKVPYDSTNEDISDTEIS